MGTKISKWYFPENKLQAMEYLDIGLKVSITKDLAGFFGIFYKTLGIEDLIPEGKRGRIEFLNLFHKSVSLDNPDWPDSIPFEYLYNEFFEAIVTDQIKLHGSEILDFRNCFSRWYANEEVRDKINNGWDQLRGIQTETDPEPKIDIYTADPNFDTKEAVKGLRVDQFPDAVILDQYNTITTILYDGLTGKRFLEGLNAEAYMYKIIVEAQERGLV